MKKKLWAIILTLCLIVGCLGAPGLAESAQTGVDIASLFSKRDISGDYDAAEAVAIRLTGESASCDSAAVTVDGGVVTITDEGVYVLSGTLNGMIIVDAEKTDKVQLVLDGAAVTSATSAALYVRQADKVFVTLAEGAGNTLANGGEFVAIDENDIDAAVFSKEDLTLNGAGSLTVLSPAGHGVVSKDDLAVTGGTYVVEAAGHGLSGKDSVRILDGAFTLTAGKDGIHSENNDDADKGFVAIAGGDFAIAADGDGVSASNDLQIDGGRFTIVTGGGSANATAHAGARGFGGFSPNGYTGGEPAESTGGLSEIGMPAGGRQGGGHRGGQTPGGQTPGGQMPGGWDNWDASSSADSVSCKALKADGALILNGGAFSIDAADDAIHAGSDIVIGGGSYDIATGDDGVHTDENLIINDCAMNITQSYEGLEGLTITINGGDIALVSSDDGLNAAGGNDGSGFGGWGDMFSAGSDSQLVINGGTLTVNAQGDGLDSNGALVINGGVIRVSGPTNSGNGALDYGASAAINGGSIIAVGASGMAVSFGSGSTQGSIMVNVGSQSAGSTVTLTDANGQVLLSWQPEKAYQSVVVSCEGLQVGGAYTLTAGSYSEEITLSSISYGASSGMGGFGGGFGGGWR